MRLRFHARPGRAALLASLLGVLVLAANAPGAAAADTQTALGSAPLSPVWGQSVTVTATVKENPDTGNHPTGTVTFTLEGVDRTVPVVAGVASFSPSALEVGSHAVHAVFTGDPGFTNSSADLTLTVRRASVSVTETVVPDPTVAGQSATFAATVAVVSPGAGTPTGTVQFRDDDGTPILGPVSLSGGTASLSVPAAAGSYRVHATYSGDVHFLGNSTTVDQTVNKADTATTLTGSAAQVAPGQSVVLTAIVGVTPPGDVPTFGSLQFSANGIPVGNPLPLGGAMGVRVTLTAPQAPGRYVIGVAYGGDDNTNPSSASLPITVGAAGGGSAVGPQQLKAVGSTLMQALRKRGLAALRGTPEPFTAPVAGVLQQEVDSPKPLKAAKAVRLASGRHAFSGPGRGVLKLRLTAAGRRAIRQGKTLRLAIVTTFKPTKGTPVSVVQRVTVKAKKAGKAAQLGGGWSVAGARLTGSRTARVQGRI